MSDCKFAASRCLRFMLEGSVNGLKLGRGPLVSKSILQFLIVKKREDEERLNA